MNQKGYDIEDIMINNKSAHERGFAHGTIYKSETIDLDDYRTRGELIKHHFSFGEDISPALREKLVTNLVKIICLSLELD